MVGGRHVSTYSVLLGSCNAAACCLRMWQKSPPSRIRSGFFRTSRKVGFQMHSTVLDLCAQWVSKRKRWWCVMAPSSLPPFHLDAWPVSSSPTCLQDVIPHWPMWGQQEEEELQWSAEEVSKYEDPAYGSDLRRFPQAC